ncbi:hypothetical protein [Paraburkholderia hayleyella]|nr:hypothetical protein [Paraburkholderia hayleyella]
MALTSAWPVPRHSNLPQVAAQGGHCLVVASSLQHLTSMKCIRRLT